MKLSQLRSSKTVDVLLIAVILIPLFVINGRWGVEANVDAIATAAPAWKLVETGTIDLSEYAGANPWLVQDKDGRLVSDRAPGLIVSAIPGYLVWRVDNFSNGPATLVALIATFMAVVAIWSLVLPLVGRGWALISAVGFALTTSTWAVSSSQLWPHGVGQLAAVFALGSFARARYGRAGAASAFAVFTRPVTSVYAGVMGLAESWRERDARIAFRYGLVASLGLLAVFLYNFWLFDQFALRVVNRTVVTGITGGAGSNFELTWYLENLWAMFFSVRHGLFVLSPVVLVATYGAIRYRQLIPGWAKSAALGAFAYLLIHAALNRASGGAELSYRYPLEPLALASVALIIGIRLTYQQSRLWRITVLVAAAASVALQFAIVFYFSCVGATPNTPACFYV